MSITRAADKADHQVDGYSPGASLEECISDLLGDMRHLCDKYGLDFAERDEVGQRNYISDLEQDKAAEARAGGRTFR